MVGWRGAVSLGVVLLLVAGCSADATSSSPESPSRNSQGGESPTVGTIPSSSPAAPSVEHRASEPTEVDAPGIVFTEGHLNVTVAGREVTISAEEWNTISRDSRVPHDIGVTLDPDFHAAQPSRNRFQYLADKLLPFIPDQFYPLGIIADASEQEVVAVVALFNNTDDTYEVSGLTVKVIQEPPTTVVAEATYYGGADQGLVVPGVNVTFLRLALPAVASSPEQAVTTTYDFSWAALRNCGTGPC
ncbi:hypothetical protein [Modestobacter marinus]|uniref:hypothetical protein n=1 Tax=Modestobacter marinus TaxID=477641 RepID=UPI001C98DB4F|nr:hypothetical protein [Modestobacter marinus]